MDVRDAGGALWRQRLLVVVILVVTGGAVGVGVWLSPKTYAATASVSTEKDPAVAATAEDLNALRATIAELASSRGVVLAVQGQLRAQYDVDRTAEELARSIHGEWAEPTILVRVTAEDRDPDVAAHIANLAAGQLDDVAPSAGSFDFQLDDPAEPPDTFSSPDLRLVVPLGVAAAVLLAVAGAMIRDRRANTVDDAAAVEEAAVAPLLAHLPPPRDVTSLPTLQPGTAAAERFRHLRMVLDFEAASGSPKIVVAGVTSGDATVWLAANVAIALAGIGRRVLLVDGRMGDRFGRPLETEPGTVGLYDVLHGIPLERALSPGPVELLSVLPAGNEGAEPVEDLVRHRFESVMAQAAEDFDVVVVLAPPLDMGADARLMAVGGALLLAVPQGGVSSSSLRRHTDHIRAMGARLLGVVLIGRRAEAMAV